MKLKMGGKKKKVSINNSAQWKEEGEGHRGLSRSSHAWRMPEMDVVGYQSQSLGREGDHHGTVVVVLDIFTMPGASPAIDCLWSVQESKKK